MIKIMTDKEKILKYLDYKGISKNKFYTQTGLSVGFLDSGSSLGVDKLKIIIDNYHDFNLEWFIYGRGEIVKNENVEKNIPENIAAEPQATYDAGGWKAKYEAIHEKYTELLERHNALLTNKLEEIIKDKSAI